MSPAAAERGWVRKRLSEPQVIARAPRADRDQAKGATSYLIAPSALHTWCPGTELNRRHEDFQAQSQGAWRAGIWLER